MANAYFHVSQGKKDTGKRRNLLGGTYFTIHSYTHTGDIPAASISEKYFPPSGTVDISLFVYKSFAVMQWTHLNWTGESVCFAPETSQHVFTNYAEPMCHSSESREKGKSRKVRKGERQAANHQELRKESTASENIASQSKQHTAQV